MPANAFDDLPPGLVPAVPAGAAAPSANAPNAFDDITPPPRAASEKPPVTAADRVQAAEGGILRGGAYLAGLIPDTILNTIDLGKAGLGYGYHELTGKPIPSALEVNDEPSPVGQWLTQQLDKSPITTTQPTRPDDTTSRYLATAGSVVPAVLSGGGSIASIPGTVAKAAIPAMAGQYVAEAKPFSSDAANNAATVLTQALTTKAMPRGRGAPIASPANDSVRAAQEAGYVFPPATTNPTLTNRTLESVAGKTSVQQHAAIENQAVTNNQGRAAMGVPEAAGPITESEVVQGKAQAAPGYDALRGAGQINAPQNFAQQLAAALTKQSGASKLDPSLTNTALETTVANLGKNRVFDAGDAMDTIGLLRDKASQAYRAGDASTGAAYRGVSKVLENAIDSDLSSRGGAAADLVSGFRDSRQQFARIAQVEDALNPTTRNLQAQKLAAALKGGDYMDGPLRVTAQAAGQAPRAFAEPTSSAASHMNILESGMGAILGEGAFGHLGLLGAAAIPASRWAARQYALGLGQVNALQRAPGQIDPRLIAAGLTSAPPLLGPGR